MLKEGMDSKYSKTCNPQKGMKSAPGTEKLQRWFLSNDLFNSGYFCSIKSRSLTVQAHEQTQHEILVLLILICKHIIDLLICTCLRKDALDGNFLRSLALLTHWSINWLSLMKFLSIPGRNKSSVLKKEKKKVNSFQGH